MFESEHSASAVVVSIAMLGLAWVLKRITGTWASPPSLFSLFWFIASFLPLVFLWGYPVNVLSVLYVFVATTMFGLPALAFNWKHALRSNRANSQLRSSFFSSSALYRSLYGMAVSSMILIVLDLNVQGISASGFISSFYVSSNEYMVLRYSGDVEANLFASWGNVFAYVCPIIGGLLHVGVQSRLSRAVVMLASFLPAILILLVQAAKGLFLLAIIEYIGSIIMVRVLLDVRPHVNFKSAIDLIPKLAIGFPFLVIAFIARGLYEEADAAYVFSELWKYFLSYAFTHIYAFSDWFAFYVGRPATNNYAVEGLSLGYYNYISLFRVFGVDRPYIPGVYAEYLALDGLRPGNIYTVFRGAIQDFGVAGSLVYFMLLGWVFSGAFYVMLRSSRPLFSMVLYCVFIQFMYTSYIVSAFIWTTTYVAAVLTLVVLFVGWVQVRPGKFCAQSVGG